MAYSNEDINSAVAAGAITSDAADALRAHVSGLRNMPTGDEENFRLINSFNDIFVSIGIVILLIAVGAIGNALAEILAPSIGWNELYNSMEGDVPSDAEYAAQRAANDLNTSWSLLISGLLVAVTSWPLAEFFTRKRRLALPSIILLLAFVGGIFAAVNGMGLTILGETEESAGAYLIGAAGLIAAGAAYLHWRRFMVPITVAAGAGAIAVTVLSILAGIYLGVTESDPGNFLLTLTFIAGLTIWLLAMRWDISDTDRTTRRSDVAFWLHLLAAPMLAHPVFFSLGVIDGGDSIGLFTPLVVVAIYIVFGLVALAIDRRALLVSALAYVLAALTYLFREFGAVELNFALTALVIGSALLTLSAFWPKVRAAIVTKLPSDWQVKLPAVQT
jgi:hypothetical protein